MGATSASIATRLPTKCTRRTQKKQSACMPTSRKSKRLPSSLSSVKNGKSSPGAQPSCQEYRASSQSTHYASNQTQSQRSRRYNDSPNPNPEQSGRKQPTARRPVHQRDEEGHLDR